MKTIASSFSTELPLKEAKNMGAKATFRNRLMETVDEEEFLHPPWLKIVGIELESKEVYSEGIGVRFT